MHQVRWSRLRHEWSRKATRRERTQLRGKLEAVMALGLELQHFRQMTLRSVRGRRTIKLLQTSSILDGIRFTAKVAVKLNTVDDLVLEGLDSNQSIVDILEIHEALSGLLVWVHLQTVLLHNTINNFANLRENVVHVLFIDLVSDALRQKAHVDLCPCVLLRMAMASLAQKVQSKSATHKFEAQKGIDGILRAHFIHLHKSIVKSITGLSSTNHDRIDWPVRGKQLD